MIRTGFFNSNKGSLKLYGAEDLSFFYELYFTNGVYPTPSDSLQVYVTEGMGIKVRPGISIIKGKWLNNDADITYSLDIGDASYARKDLVVVQYNKTIEDMQIIIKKGTPASSPTSPELIRNDYLYEICLAEITVAKQAQSITQSAILDTRQNSDVCGIVVPKLGEFDTSTLWNGYETAFNEWFDNIKETVLSSFTLIRSFVSSYTVTSSSEKIINIGIAQFNKEIDILQVFVNGIFKLPTVDYEVTSNNVITFTNGLNVSDVVTFIVCKSMNADGVTENIVNDVAELQTLTKWNKQAIYYCNGVNDNIKLSKIAQDFLTSTGDYASLSSDAEIEIKVVGTIGVNGFSAGTGTSDNPMQIFTLGKFTNTETNQDSTTSKRKITFDFTSCSQISATGTDGYNIVMFGGNEVSIKGCTAILANGSQLSMFTGQGINCKDCKLYINGKAQEVVIGAICCGTFNNVRLSATSGNGKCTGFSSSGVGILRLTDCEILVYNLTGTTELSIGVLAEANATESVVIMDRCNIPLRPRSGYKTSETVKINSGFYCLTGNVLGKASAKYSTDTTNGKTEIGTMIITK